MVCTSSEDINHKYGSLKKKKIINMEESKSARKELMECDWFN